MAAAGKTATRRESGLENIDSAFGLVMCGEEELRGERGISEKRDKINRFLSASYHRRKCCCFALVFLARTVHCYLKSLALYYYIYLFIFSPISFLVRIYIYICIQNIIYLTYILRFTPYRHQSIARGYGFKTTRVLNCSSPPPPSTKNPSNAPPFLVYTPSLVPTIHTCSHVELYNINNV